MNDQQQVQMFSHQQEQSKVIGKNTNTGNYILKVHLLSNAEALNGNRYDYRDVSELPESFLNELVALPAVPDHFNKEMQDIYSKLNAEGKTDCEIRDVLLKRSKEVSMGVLDDIYRPGKLIFNSMIPETELYGALEVTDPTENKYIDEHGEPSKKYTSIATAGEYMILENGKTVYTDMAKVRPFHIALANTPAFGKEKARIRGVCKGEKTICKNKLMFQSLDTNNNESINTHGNDNTNMSDLKQELVKDTPTANKEIPAPTKKLDHEPPTAGDQERKEKQDQDEILKKPAPEDKEPAPNKSPPPEGEPTTPNKKDEGEEKKDDNDTEARLAKLTQELEDQKRTYRKSLLKFSVDPKAFKSEDELQSEQQRVMNILEGYNFKNEDAEWLVTRAFPKITTPQQTDKKGSNPTYNSILFDAASATKSYGDSSPPPPTVKKERNNTIENEY